MESCGQDLSQIFEVACKQCQAIHDLDQDPGVINWNCPCVTGEGSTLLKAYWITCSINRRHHYWSNRSEDCKLCADEKANKPIISLKNLGVTVHGEKIPVVDESKPAEPLPYGVMFDALKKEPNNQKNREDEIISLLQDIKQILTPRQEPDTIANELRDDK